MSLFSVTANSVSYLFDKLSGGTYVNANVALTRVLNGPIDGSTPAVVDKTNPFAVRNDIGARVAGVYDPAGAATATMARPADTVAYAALDLYANSTTGASVKAFGFVIPNFTAGDPLSILRASIGLSNIAATFTSIFRLHLFGSDPTASWTATGDNVTLDSKLALNTSGYFGSIDMQPDRNGSDLQIGAGTPVGGPILCNPPGTTIFGLLQLLTTYVPASAQTARLWLEVGR